MKQVTGRTNPRPAVKKVSIQLALDGHSFSIAGCEGLLPEPVVTVEILTARTLLVPEALFDPQHAATLLAADGKRLQTGEVTVHSAPHNGVVAVMAVPAQALQQLRQQFDADTVLTYTTPLLPDIHPKKPTVLLRRTGSYLYIKVYNPSLQLAEVLPAPTDADILYAVERLDSQFPAKEHHLLLKGRGARPLIKLVGKRYKQVRCE